MLLALSSEMLQVNPNSSLPESFSCLKTPTRILSILSPHRPHMSSVPSSSPHLRDWEPHLQAVGEACWTVATVISGGRLSSFLVWTSGHCRFQINVDRSLSSELILFVLPVRFDWVHLNKWEGVEEGKCILLLLRKIL